MLFRFIPHQDTKPIAKALLARFSSLADMLAAEPQRIAKVSGAAPAVAQDLKLTHALLPRAQKGERASRTVLCSSGDPKPSAQDLAITRHRPRPRGEH